MQTFPLIRPVVTHPLFGLVLTVATYACAERLYRMFGQRAVLHPVMTTICAVAAVVVASGMGYDRYFAQAAPLHYALGVFVALLAVPLLRQLPRLRADGTVLMLALVAGSVVAMGTALVPADILDAEPALIATLAPKSTTAAVAIGISDRLGGEVGLTAVVVIVTGVAGAAFGPALLRTSGVDDDRAVGLALGLASHGIGTARAFQISERAGAFATIGMIVNAVLTVILAPFAVGLLA